MLVATETNAAMAPPVYDDNHPIAEKAKYVPDEQTFLASSSNPMQCLWQR